METVDGDGAIRDEAGAPVDRIEGGTLTRSAREFRGIAPGTVLIGAMVVVLFGLFLGWYLFHSRSSAARATLDMTPGTATSVPQRDAITEAQARQAILGKPGASGGTSSGTAAGTAAGGPGGEQLPVGMSPGQVQPGGTALQTGSSGQHPINPRVALDTASRRSPIMGFSGTLNGPGEASRGQGGSNPFEAAAERESGQGDQRGGEGAASLQSGPIGGQAPDSLSSQLAHHVIATAHATVVPNRSFLLSAGTLIPCTLQTAINSTQAGYVSCVIGQDVYSEDGRVILLDKGTKVLGQYSGGIAQGQARLFVLWTRALTPRGIAIDLGSPASDDLGRAGMPGGVDTMFWQRFGGALMLSVLEDLGNVASSHFANRGSQTTQVPADTAGVALQNSINIRPILKKNQGDQVGIFVAKDFDFSGVYDVHIRQ